MMSEKPGLEILCEPEVTLFYSNSLDLCQKCCKERLVSVEAARYMVDDPSFYAVDMKEVPGSSIYEVDPILIERRGSNNTVLRNL